MILRFVPKIRLNSTCNNYRKENFANYHFFSTFVLKFFIMEQNLLQEQEVFRHQFSFSQEQVNRFADVTGDKNPIHWDETYAATTIFKRPIMHGMLSAAVFSKIFGTTFPGEGTIFMRQDLKFMKPMFVDKQYEAVFTIKEINRKRHTGIITTQILDLDDNSLTLDGEAELMHRGKF